MNDGVFQVQVSNPQGLNPLSFFGIQHSTGRVPSATRYHEMNMI